MTTAHHSALPFGGSLTSAAMEAPLSQLDAAIASVIATGSGVSTTLTAQANAGQASLTVASSAGYTPGDPIYIGTGATFESRIVNTVPGGGVTITVTVNLTNTYAIGQPVSKSPVEIVDARGGKITLGARISLIEGRVFDVMASPYNAVGDNSTDDRAAIQAAIDAAFTAGGGTVLLPKLHRIAAELTAMSKVSIVGVGRGSGLTGPAGTAMSLIRGTSVTDVTIADMTIDGNQAANGGAADADAVIFTGTSVNCVVRSCFITKGARDGIAFRGTSRGCAAIGNYIELSREDGITINGEGHRLVGNYIFSTWGDGILIKSAVRCVVEGNVVDSPGTGAPSAGISLGGDGAAANDYNAIVGNTVRNATGSSYYFANSTYCTISGNTARDSALGMGVVGVRDSAIVGNTIDNMAGNGIDVNTSGAGTTSDRLSIANNTISRMTGTGKIGISVAGSGVGIQIVGNTVNSVTGHGIQVTSNSAQITGNYISGVTVATFSGIRVTGSDILIAANQIVTPKMSGIHVSTGTRVRIDGNYVSNAGNRGIFMDATVNSTCNGNLVRNSGIDGVVGEGIAVNNAADIALTGNRCYDDQGTKTQSHGIRSIGTSDWLVVAGNSCRGNATASVTLVGANNQTTGANT